MKIVGVAACTVGIAHTYIAREKLMEAAKKHFAKGEKTTCLKQPDTLSFLY